MSIDSKASRDARRRRLAKSGAGAGDGDPIEAHAQLRDQAGRLLGGIVRRDGAWTLGLDGRIVGDSDSAARVLAMLERAAALHERQGENITMSCSPGLRSAAAREVAAQGLTFEQFQAQLEMELAASNPQPLETSGRGTGILH